MASGMRDKASQERSELMAAFKRVAVFFLFAAVFVPLAFSQHSGRHREWRNMEREHERRERNAYGFITYFYIDEIEREDGKIEIEFNAPVDPRTVSRESILINGAPLPPDAFYKLSRKGTKIEIAEAREWRGRTISIEAVNLRSINGTEIEIIPPIFMAEDEEYDREDDLEFVYWYWYDSNGGRAFERER